MTIASDIELNAGIRFVPRTVTAADLVDGVLTLSMTSDDPVLQAEPLLLLDNAVSLKGIRLIAGEPFVDITTVRGGQLITLYCPSGSATLEHEAPELVDGAEVYRFNVYPSTANLEVLRNATQFVYDAVAERWLPTDWGFYTGSAVDFASHPGSRDVAIERIAAAVAGLLGNPIPD